MNVKDKNAIIKGASSGIGVSTAQLISKRELK